MSDILKALTQTDENEAIPDVSPKELEELANTPATRLSVIRAFEKHGHGCWAKRKLRQYTWLGAFVLGALAVINIYVLRTLPIVVKEATRQTVIEVLKERDALKALTMLEGGAR